MKPTDVLLVGMPLTDTFGQCEMEIAAACLVRACQLRGDTWSALLWTDVRDALKTDVTNGTQPFASIARNPFAQPDFHALIENGWARKIDNPEDPAIYKIELTPAAIERIGLKWARDTGTMVLR